MIDRIRRFAWPLLIVGGLAIVATSQTVWGYSNEGAQLRITGLGGVEARAAASGDVESFFNDLTQRPGLLTIVLGFVIVLAALVGWWAPVRQIRAASLALGAVIAAVGTAVAIWALLVVLDPTGRLFDSGVIEAADTPGQLLSPGWGLVATLVLGILTAGLAIVATALRWLAPKNPDGADATSQ